MAKGPFSSSPRCRAARLIEAHVRLQRRGGRGNRDRIQQPLLGKQLQHSSEHFSMRLDIYQPSARDRRMIRRRLVDLDPQNRRRGIRVFDPPGDAAL